MDWRTLIQQIHSNSLHLTTTWYARATRQLYSDLNWFKKKYVYDFISCLSTESKIVSSFSIEMQNHFVKCVVCLFFLGSFVSFSVLRWFNGREKRKNANIQRKCSPMEWDISLFWHAFVCHLKMKASWSHYSVDSQNFVYILVDDATHYVHFHIQFEYIRIQTNTEARNGIKKLYTLEKDETHARMSWQTNVSTEMSVERANVYIQSDTEITHKHPSTKPTQPIHIQHSMYECLLCCVQYVSSETFPSLFSFKRIVKLENCNITTYPNCFSFN